MRLPKDLISGTFRKPDVYLCEVDKTKICKLETFNMQASLKFNSYSELSFEVARTYNDNLTGEIKVNPFYDKIEALRLVYVEGFGYFELQGPEVVEDGIKESKLCTAYSYEYTLSQKYLEDFYVGTGEVDSIEVINAKDLNGDGKIDYKDIIPVVLYNPHKKELSLLDLILEKDYAGWSIGHVDKQLCTLSRQFEVPRQSIYDFIMNELCEKFNCYAVFEVTEEKNIINLYAEFPTKKIISDGVTRSYTIEKESAVHDIQTVSIDGRKTTQWTFKDGVLTLTGDIPEKDLVIEVVGVDSQWETDVFVTFENLSQEIKVNYDADNIKTVLTVKFGEDNNIREVNLGLPYITDLSYYTNEDWMGADLYKAWNEYEKACNDAQPDYTTNAQQILYWAGQIDYEENRLSLGYAKATVDETTVGTYYVRGGNEPDYYFTAVSLPSEYNANTDYYSTKTTNLEDGANGNVYKLYEAFKAYFMGHKDWRSKFVDLAKSFSFMPSGKNMSSLLNQIQLVTNVEERIDNQNVNTITNAFLDAMWNEIGRTPLKTLFYETYKKLQTTGMDSGWAERSSTEYGNYYASFIFLNSIEKAIKARDATISTCTKFKDDYVERNINISNSLLLSKNFTKGQLVRLNAFLREDELNVDGIIITSQDSVQDTFKAQQDAMESARIELKKISQPQLQFTMNMANIYALPEFEPIVDQFQLGRMIKVGLRPDYIKQSRLLQVNINFEDFSDFSCEFGELKDISKQSDLHADLLKNAVSAGKSVAQNASYWTKGADKVTDIDLRLQEGLLNSIEALKSMDATQSAYMDKYGLHLEKVDPETGKVDDKRVWLVNNQIVFTDDGFKTSKTVLGEFEIEGQKSWGLVADAVIAGHVEGSKIKGGTIRIGEYTDENGVKKCAFEVDENGNVKMNASNTIKNYSTTGEMTTAINASADSITTEISSKYVTKDDANTKYATQSQTQHYGICATPSATAAKVVQCDGFSLYKGATVAVNFAYKNTAASPTLNVNNTGAKSIFLYNLVIQLNSALNWSDNSVVMFVYDGIYWRMADSGALQKTEELSSKITQTATDIELSVSKTYVTKDTLKGYSTTEQMKAAIKVEADKISSKVSYNELGTEIVQNSDSVRIAWNKNSNYIQFEDGAMCIYTSDTHNDNNLLMKHNQNGVYYYHSGAVIGKIGTNKWSSNSDYKGLVFDLEYKASYMCWAQKNSEDAKSYTAKLIYHSGRDVNGVDATSSIASAGIHLGCHMYLNNWKCFLNDNVYITPFNNWNGGIVARNGRELILSNISQQNGCGVRIQATRIVNEGASAIECRPDVISFYTTDEKLIDCYNNIDMHNWNVLNQSDVRLKTNIEDTNVDALTLINQIEMKEFDWINTHEHENIGIIAQQLQQVIPDLVHEDVNGKMSIKTNKFIPYLIKAIQELTEYITGGISMFSTRNKWTDFYTIEEKEQFISQYISDGVCRETDIKEAVGKEILLPI